MEETAIRDADIAFGGRCTIEPLAAFFIGQLDEAKPFGWEVEGAMKAPQAIVFLGLLPGLWNGCPIEQANAPAVWRRLDTSNEQFAYEVFHPGAAVAQALQQSNIGKIREAGRSSPGARRSQPQAAEAISQDQPEQIGRGLHRAGAQKGSRFAGGRLDGCGTAKSRQRGLPEFVQKRSGCHAMLESDSILPGKPYVRWCNGPRPRP